MKKLLLILGLLALVFKLGFAHCEIPCGIYDDELRIKLLYEDVTTIEKSTNEIISLSKEGEKNYNQLVRWVVNKEEHADKMQEIMSQYFLTQRIKPADKKSKDYPHYVDNLKAAHEVIVYAMKAKQNADPKVVDQLREAVHEFEHIYMGIEEK